jgi:hypothetical protein
MKNNRVCIFIAHEYDSAWKLISPRLKDVLSEGLIQEFCVLTVIANAEIGVDPEVEVTRIDASGDVVRHSSSLLGYLSSLGAVDGITLAAVRCDSSDAEFNEIESRDLDRAVKKARQLLMRFAADLVQHNFRIAVIGEGEKAPGSPFFSPIADANVVAMPRDISMTMAVARPIFRENEQTFVAHAAMELSSILGLWTTMDSGPLDDFRQTPLGKAGYRLHLFSSRVKGLVTPPLPIADLVDDSSELPLPSGYSAVENLSTFMERYASTVFPSNMVFTEIEEPDSHIRRSWRDIVGAYISEFGRTLRSIPSMMNHGFRGEIDVIGANALDRLLGGADAKIRPIIPAEDEEADASVTLQVIEETIRDIEYRQDRPLVGVVSPEEWEKLITQVLGVADAHPQVDALRQTVMPAGLLVRDKTYLAPNAPSIGSLVEMIVPRPAEPISEPSVEQADEGPVVPDADTPVTSEEFESEQTEEVAEEKSEEAADAVETELVTPFAAIDINALREAVRRSGIERSDAHTANGDAVDLQAQGVAAEVDKQDKTLVGSLTSRFDKEFNNSEESVLGALNELRTLPGRFKSSDFGRVSRSVFITIAIALAAIVVSLSTHNPLRSVFSFDWVSSRNRDFIWVAFSSIVFIIGIATMPSGKWRNWQSRIMFTSALCAGILGFEYVIFDFARDKIVSIPWGGTTAFVGTIILLATCGLILFSMWRNSVSEDSIRKRLARVMSFILWLYVVTGLSAYIAGSESFIINWENGTRLRFLIATQFVSWLCLMMGLFVIVAVRVRQRNAFSRYQERFNWAEMNLTASIDARSHLRVAYMQWLSTAAILSRVIWYPLGREANDRIPFEGKLASDESILKFDLAEIELSERGHTALLAQLKQLFVREGWLKKQFEYARESYKAELAEITQDPIDMHDPLACVGAPSIEDLVSGEARGDRYEFAKKLVGGEFDAMLLSSATLNNLDAVYANILSDVHLHNVEEAQNDFDSGANFLSDIVPGQPTTLPPFILRGLLVPGDESLKLKNHLWWPQTSLISSPSSDHATIHASNVLALERLNDSVVMIAVLVGLSEAFINSDVTCVEDLVDLAQTNED